MGDKKIEDGQYVESISLQQSRMECLLEDIESGWVNPDYWVENIRATLDWLDTIQECVDQIHDRRYDFVKEQNEGYTKHEDGFFRDDLRPLVHAMNWVINTLNRHGLGETQECFNKNLVKVLESTEEYKRTKDLGAGI